MSAPKVRSQIGPFGIVPRWVRERLRSEPRALVMYALLAERMDWPEQGETAGRLSRSRAWLARELDCSPDTVDRLTKRLEDVGAIQVVRTRTDSGHNLVNAYDVYQVPPATESSEAVEPVGEGGRTDAAIPGGVVAAPTRLPNGGGSPRGRGHPRRTATATPGRVDAAQVIQTPTPDPFSPDLTPSSSTHGVDPAATNGHAPLVASQSNGKPERTDDPMESMSDRWVNAREVTAVLTARWAAAGFGTRKRLTPTMVRQADLLLRLGADHWAEPEPVPFDRVVEVIDALFDRLAQESGTGDFCWAKVTQAPGSLRRHWDRIVAELEAPPRQRARSGVSATAENSRRIVEDALRRFEAEEAAEEAAVNGSGPPPSTNGRTVVDVEMEGVR